MSLFDSMFSTEAFPIVQETHGDEIRYFESSTGRTLDLVAPALESRDPEELGQESGPPVLVVDVAMSDVPEVREDEDRIEWKGTEYLVRKILDRAGDVWSLYCG